MTEEIQLEKVLGRGGTYADPLLLFKIKKEMMSMTQRQVTWPFENILK